MIGLLTTRALGLKLLATAVLLPIAGYYLRERCPLCSERPRQMNAHLWLDHGDQGWGR